MQRTFDAVVLCAGTASRQFAANLGDRVNIYPVKGYSITVNLTDEESQAAAPEVSLLDGQTKLVTSRLGRDRFHVAGTAEFKGLNRNIMADRIKLPVDWVQVCFPGVSTRDVVPLAGLRSMMLACSLGLNAKRTLRVLQHRAWPSWLDAASSDGGTAGRCCGPVLTNMAVAEFLAEGTYVRRPWAASAWPSHPVESASACHRASVCGAVESCVPPAVESRASHRIGLRPSRLDHFEEWGFTRRIRHLTGGNSGVQSRAKRVIPYQA